VVSHKTLSDLGVHIGEECPEEEAERPEYWYAGR